MDNETTNGTNGARDIYDQALNGMFNGQPIATAVDQATVLIDRLRKLQHDLGTYELAVRVAQDGLTKSRQELEVTKKELAAELGLFRPTATAKAIVKRAFAKKAGRKATTQQPILALLADGKEHDIRDIAKAIDRSYIATQQGVYNLVSKKKIKRTAIGKVRLA